MKHVKAVVLRISDEELQRRRRLGLDHHDEMWAGVLYIPSPPTTEQQRIVGELLAFLLNRLKATGRGRVALGINVFRRADDYRVPDITFIAAGHEGILQVDGAHGGPDAEIEVRSPDDETYDKFDFFAEVGVREVVVVDRDTKKPEVFRLAGAKYLAIAADREGWVVSETMRVRFRLASGPKLVVEDLDDSAARAEI